MDFIISLQNKVVIIKFVKRLRVYETLTPHTKYALCIYKVRVYNFFVNAKFWDN